MLKKLSLIGVFALALTGCATTYDFMPSSKTKNIISIDKETRVMVVDSNHASIEVKSLTNEVGPWIDPIINVKITNKSDIILGFKSSDIRMGFNNFWFDAYEYEIIDENREENFRNNDNFRMIHEVLPGKTIEIQLKYNSPKSVEYYERKDVLIEVYTDLALFNVIYKIDRK